MPRKEFFSNKADWSRRKHLIISYYLDPAIKKLRYASPDNRVIILDGFAGRGRYKEGTSGSPIYTGELAEKCRIGDRPLKLFVRNVEPDTDTFMELEKATTSWVQKGYIKNINQTFQQALPAVLSDAEQSPLFAFLDPFTPKQLEFSDLLPLLHRNAKTEVCAVFFTRFVQRNLQALKPNSKSKSKFRITLGNTMTRVFGNVSWQNLINEEKLEFDDILNCIGEQIREEARKGYSGEPGYVCKKAVYATKNGHMKYHMLFWTRHIDGAMLMNDAFVKESGDLEEMTQRQIDLAKEKKSGGQIGLDLFSDLPSEKDIELANSFSSLCDSLISLGRHLSAEIVTRETLIEKSILNRFGEFSRTKHRQAIQSLVDRQESPKIIALDGKQKKDGTWTINENTRLQFQL